MQTRRNECDRKKEAGPWSLVGTGSGAHTAQLVTRTKKGERRKKTLVNARSRIFINTLVQRAALAPSAAQLNGVMGLLFNSFYYFSLSLLGRLLLLMCD
jgi:hypothetical protein